MKDYINNFTNAMEKKEKSNSIDSHKLHKQKKGLFL